MKKIRGNYIILATLEENWCLRYRRKKKKHNYALAPGFYLYVGSAKGGLRQRVARHMGPRPSKDKNGHWPWDIDYVLHRGRAEALEAWGMESPRKNLEHEWVRTIRDADAGTTLIEDFGDGDCKQGCGGHLFRVDRRPSVNGVRKILGLRSEALELLVRWYV